GGGEGGRGGGRRPGPGAGDAAPGSALGVRAARRGGVQARGDRTDDGRGHRHFQGAAAPGPAAVEGGTRPMTCDEVRTKLDEYVDGELGEAAFQEIELHLAGCAECRGEERRMRALLARAAALPREIQPGRDLWPELAERLRRGDGAGVVLRPRVARWLQPMTLAAAAA